MAVDSSDIPSPYTNDTPPEVETHSNQQHIEIADVLSNTEPPPVIISASDHTSDEQKVVVESSLGNWQEINQTKIGLLNQINQEILESNQQYLFTQGLFKKALKVQQKLSQNISKSFNEIPAPYMEAKVDEIMDSEMRSIISLPSQSSYYGEHLSALYDKAIRQATIRLSSINNAVISYKQSLKSIEQDITLKRQELSENNAENKRVETFKTHLALINKLSLEAEDSIFQLENLTAFREPITRFGNSEFKGVPNVKGVTLMSIAACRLDFSAMKHLLILGYKLSYNSSALINPLDTIIEQQGITKFLNEFGDKLSRQSLNKIFKLYLLPLTTINVELKLTEDHINTLIYIIDNRSCIDYANKIFELVFKRDERLSNRSSLIFKYFNDYKNFNDLKTSQRVEFIRVILNSAIDFPQYQQQFLNLYNKSSKLYAINLLDDFNSIDKFDIALNWVIASTQPLNIINNELLEHAYVAYKQGEEALLINSLTYNQQQVRSWFDSLESRSEQPNIKLDLICLNANCFEIKQCQSAFNELDASKINSNFSYLCENLSENNEALTKSKILTIFAKEQIIKTEDLNLLLELSKQVNDIFESLEDSDKYKELILKQIKNKMLSILKINSDVEPDLKSNIKVFMASHRTKGWSLFCGLLYIPPTLLATPSSKIYDAIVKDNKEQAKLKLSKQQQNFETSYENLFQSERSTIN